MLDINFIRQNPEKVKEGYRKKQANVDIGRLLELDKEKRELLGKIGDLQHQANLASEEIAKEKLPNKRDSLIEKAKKLKTNVKEIKERLETVNSDFDKLMFRLPNLPLDDVIEGKDENDNKVLRKEGKPPKFDFPAKDHLEIGEALNIIDVKRAAKVSGSRFGYLKKEASLLEFALVGLALGLLTKKGFLPLIPPVLIKKEMMKGMGYIDTEKDLEERYFLEKDKLFLVGTAEQSIVPMRSNEVFKEEELPKRYIGFSSCFRREAGSYGKDTRGILRVHQFDKLEMVVYSKPENSEKEHQFLLSLEEKIMKELNIPYQVIDICSGDLGQPAAKKYDIEAWLPGQNKYRETHSVSNCTDFQSRRLNVRYKNKEGKTDYVHILNGTAIAIGRTIIAILENNQRKDGRINVPKVLRKYLPGKPKIIPFL